MSVIVLLTASLLQPGPDVVLDRPVPALVTGPALNAELGRPLTATWKNAALRAVARQLQGSRKIAVLLDRRIDPTTSVSAEFSAEPLENAIRQIAKRGRAAVSVLPQAVVLGPPESVGKLRTVVELRSAELTSMASTVERNHLRTLAEGRTLHWNDLDRPTDLLETIADQYQLTIEGRERVPHDLWAGGTLPAASASTALSFVLIQFDLTFEWLPQARGVRIVPLPDDVAIERSYRPRLRQTPAQAIAEWTADVPGLKAQVSGAQVVIRGTAEQHSALAALLEGAVSRAKPSNATDPGNGPSLKDRKYSRLRFENVPARALIDKLQDTGIAIDYDAKQLTAAGIDLDRRISMDLEGVTLPEVLEKLCKPLGLKFRIVEERVVLEAK